MRLVAACRREVQKRWAEVDELALANQRRVLEALWAEGVGAHDLNGSTGYGYGDEGRDKLERVFARVFGAQAALVRPQVISGTHALRLGLFGVLRPGDHLVFATGTPYDTLESVVGLRPAPGSLAEWGVSHTVVPLTEDGGVDIRRVMDALTPRTRAVFFQRSRGYSDRRALSVGDLEAAFGALRSALGDGLVLMVDNCYGEFVEDREPTHAGADLVMGSLIKNPGGGVAPTGGYVAGRAEYVQRAAEQLTAPGIGLEAGPSLGVLRLFYQGLFLAPHTVAQALKGSILAACVLERLGFEVSPRWQEPRSDLILSARFGDPRALLAFCQAVQSAAPVDAFVRLEAAPMAGYEDQVVMAAGTFIQGGSLELSADGPMRPPYTGYMQGGLTLEHVVIALERIAEAVLAQDRAEGRMTPDGARAAGLAQRQHS
ncbi:MAG: methionine gamma-lyase family protein [Alicyclobacillus sp.]|nr:methionine gamma-lyase family protein [Alicyclobacillus sp.]MCL6516552.1 methionine gamma-lyase family protein [Alicyclobacillus sp.]